MQKFHTLRNKDGDEKSTHIHYAMKAHKSNINTRRTRAWRGANKKKFHIEQERKAKNF